MRCVSRFLVIVVALSFVAAPSRAGDAPAERWSAAKANLWYKELPWLAGCNYIPSSAINQLEMWQADTFDPKSIDRELGWAEDLGFNTVRVFLHDLAWQADADGFKKRVRKYLEIADRHHIRTLFVIFDDCWNRNPKAGKQPAPIPGVHNSGWVQSPGADIVNNPEEWGRLERYVKDVVGAFGKDRRVLFWDLYNEAGNEKQGERSLPLLKATFAWARAARPEQPLSVGVWYDNATLNKYQLAASDVITFHNYDPADRLEGQIRDLKKRDRPVLCTEFMARPRGSRFATHLPVFKKEQIGCYCWGFINGKTQTIYPWGSAKGAPEPQVWFHDILRADGTPFDAEELAAIKRVTKAKNK